MSKKPSIKWRRKDKEKIASLARTFNSKITRSLKKDTWLKDYLPNRINSKELQKTIKTRADFNRLVKSYSRFLEKGAEMPIMSKTGLKTTKWEKKEIGIRVAQINRNRTREAKKADVSTYKGTMGTIESNNLKHKKYDINKIMPREWVKYKLTVNKQVQGNYKFEKMEKYKKNYLNAILDNLGAGEKATNLYNFVLDLDPAVMYNSYYDDPVLQIQFTSDPLPVDVIAENALLHWEQLTGK